MCLLFVQCLHWIIFFVVVFTHIWITKRSVLLTPRSYKRSEWKVIWNSFSSTKFFFVFLFTFIAIFFGELLLGNWIINWFLFDFFCHLKWIGFFLKLSVQFFSSFVPLVSAILEALKKTKGFPQLQNQNSNGKGKAIQ